MALQFEPQSLLIYSHRGLWNLSMLIFESKIRPTYQQRNFQKSGFVMNS